jgi:CheY-like chemotaxis protein
MSDVPAIRVLMVEDNPADARLLRETWERQRLALELHHVETAEEALDFLERRPPFEAAPKPDLMLLDLNLPGMSGDELLRAVRANPEHRRLPVVVLTSSAQETDILRSYDLGANAFVTKPVDLEGLRQIVGGLDGFWFTIVRLPHPER